MTTYSLKKPFQNILRPIAFFLDERGYSPNQITLVAFIICTIYSTLVIHLKSYPLILFFFPFIFLIRMALNAIDGMIARERNKTTHLGALLNEAGDILSDFFLSLSFFFFSSVNMHVLWTFIYLSLLVELSGIWSYSTVQRRSFAGPMGKSDRGVALSIAAIFAGYEILTKNDMSLFLNGIFIFAIFLLIITVWNRIKIILVK